VLLAVKLYGKYRGDSIHTLLLAVKFYGKYRGDSIHTLLHAVKFYGKYRNSISPTDPRSAYGGVKFVFQFIQM
jgi:hypothetical protein